MVHVTTGKKLYEQVVDRISGMIAQGLYQKGDLLPSEKELMEMMGVGRITVRESLRLLNESGVIRTVKGKGSFVEIDCRNLQNEQGLLEYRRSFLESTDIRILLEPAVVKRVAETCDKETRQAIGDCLLSEQGELEDFHRAMIEAIGNQLLIGIFDQLWRMEGAFPLEKMLLPFQQKSVAEKFRSQHEKIYEAIRDGNGEYAYFYMKEHLEFVKRIYEEYFQTLCS